MLDIESSEMAALVDDDVLTRYFDDMPSPVYKLKGKEQVPRDTTYTLRITLFYSTESDWSSLVFLFEYCRSDGQQND